MDCFVTQNENPLTLQFKPIMQFFWQKEFSHEEDIEKKQTGFIAVPPMGKESTTTCPRNGRETEK